MKLTYREVTLLRKGYDGVILMFSGRKICIDTPDLVECDFVLHTCRERSQFFSETCDEPGLEGLVKFIAVNSSGGSVGYLMVFNNGVRVYHTGCSPSVGNVLSVEKPIHLLIIPISGGSALPEEACEVVKSLKPVLTIPIGFKDLKFFYKFRDICQPYTQVVLLTSS